MKEFEVTEEILKFFEGKKVTKYNVVKAVPNYMDYALDLKERIVRYSPTASNAANSFVWFIEDTNFMTKKEFLTKINDVFKDLDDDIEFCFNGEDLEYGNYYIQKLEEVTVKENDALVIGKITDKIRKAIKENKNIERIISDDILQSIALNPELMKKLKGLTNDN